MSGSAVSTPHRWKEMAKAIRTPEYRIAYAGTGTIWRRTGDSSPKIELRASLPDNLALRLTGIVLASHKGILAETSVEPLPSGY
jgi:hypothetical protein